MITLSAWLKIYCRVAGLEAERAFKKLLWQYGGDSNQYSNSNGGEKKSNSGNILQQTP